MNHRISFVIASTLSLRFLAGCGGTVVSPDDAVEPAKSKHANDLYRTDVIRVKFNDGLTVRAQGGQLTDLGTGDLQSAQTLLTSVAGGRWERAHSLPEDKLEQLRQNAQRNLGKPVADLNLQFNLFLPAGANASDAIDAFNALDIVEIALPMPLPPPPPVAPDFEPRQGYLDPAEEGIDAECLWNIAGGTGSGVRIADLEYSWNLNHQDLSPTTLLGAAPNDPFNDDNHGTAVLGELAAVNNGTGVTGISHDSTMYVVAVNTGPGIGVYDIGAAITTALNPVGPLGSGDVILIEQQIAGPNYTGVPPGTQFGLVPVEWDPLYYQAILMAVGNEVIVVEAAGNGSQNLDDPIYNVGHAPFLPANDSGAIIVGAGAAPVGSDIERSRLWFSNYGATVDLQGWGEKVYTAGYGDLYNSEGHDLLYTCEFGGTSSASPIVAGACANLLSAYEAAIGTVLTPAQVLSFLQSTGSAQQSGIYPSSQNIGPLPDAARAVAAALPFLNANSNFVPDVCEPFGACCLPGGTCQIESPYLCNAIGGHSLGVGTTCTAGVCAEPTALFAVAVYNNTGQDAADLHMTFTGLCDPIETVYVDPVSVIAPGCPVPVVPSNGLNTDTVVIDWNNTCVPDGGAVVFLLRSTPYGPIDLGSGFWTDINGLSIGPISGSDVTITPIPNGGPSPNGGFWALKSRERYKPFGDYYGSWHWPGGKCFFRWCCYAGRSCQFRVDLYFHKQQTSRLFALANCTPILDWTTWKVQPAGWDLVRTTARPVPWPQIIKGPVPNRPPPPPFAVDVPGPKRARQRPFHSNDFGTNFQEGSNFSSAFLDAAAAIIESQLGNGVPPLLASDFETIVAEISAGYCEASDAFLPLIDEILLTSIDEPDPLLDLIRMDVEMMQTSLCNMGEQMAGDFIFDPAPFQTMSEAAADLSALVAQIPSGEDRFQNASENLLAIAEGFNLAAGFVAANMYDGIDDLVQRDGFLWTVVARFPQELYQFANAMDRHARLQLQMDPALQSWGPGDVSETLVITAHRELASSGAILDSFWEQTSEFGDLLIRRPDLGGGNLDEELPLRVWFKFPAHLSRVVDVPAGDGLNIPVPALIAGDVNGDNCINEIDLAQVLDDQGLGGFFAPAVPPSDANADGLVDEEDIAVVQAHLGLCGQAIDDCNYNGSNDLTDIDSGLAADCDGNGIPDECDLTAGFAQDCNTNLLPDGCDIANGLSLDENGNGVPDECEPGACCVPFGGCMQEPSEAACVTGGGTYQGDGTSCPVLSDTDCNKNGEDDAIDLYCSTSSDANGNGVPDECEAPMCPSDLTGAGFVNAADLALLLGAWGFNPAHPGDFNEDQFINATDLAYLLGHWGPCPQCLVDLQCDDGDPCTLDECDAAGECLSSTQDAAPPTIACPPDVTLNCGDPIDPAFTGFPTVIDDCDPNPVIGYGDVPNGSCPAQSTVSRTWTGIDSAGNTASCVQFIVLTPGAPPACGDPASGDCCAPHPGPGCFDEACCSAVCGEDSSCCDAAWDDACAATASALCPDLCDVP